MRRAEMDLAFCGVVESFNLLAYSAVAEVASAQTTQPVVIKWVDPTPPGMGAGVSWGVPWTKGEIKAGQTFKAENVGG